MNKVVVLIIAVIILVVLFAVIKGNNSNIVDEESGEVVSNIDISLINVPDNFKGLVKKLSDGKYINLEDIKTDEELKLDFELDSIGEYDGIYINNDDTKPYGIVAVVVPKDNSNKDELILKMLNMHKKLKEKDPSSEELRSSKNVCMKVQGDVGIFIVSNDADMIYNMITSEEVYNQITKSEN